MTLKDISSKYQDNLIQFFSDEKIIEQIYKEQYGLEDYLANKDFYNSSYKNILNNTLFIPYITQQHLENYINSYIEKYGNDYVQKYLQKDVKLLEDLQSEKNKIVKKYTVFLIDELMNRYPAYTQWNRNDIIKLCDSNNFSENVTIIKNNFTKQNEIKQLFINEYIKKFSKIVDEKISMETSSYYFHRSQLPTNISYISIDSKIMKNSICCQKVCDSNDNNYHYVFLPILDYHNKDDYLVDAVHEIMHISKERIFKNKSQTGLIQEHINRKTSKFSEPIPNIFNSIKWNILSKKNNFYKGSKLSDTPNSITEEILHHYQVRNVVSEIKNNHLDKNLSMFYKNIESIKRTSLYEAPDALTKNFMNFFKKDIQNVNNGKLSISDFKKKIGKKNYNDLTQLYSIWIADEKNKSESLLSKDSDEKNKINFFQSQDSLFANNVLKRNTTKKKSQENKSDYITTGLKIISAMAKKAHIDNINNSKNSESNNNIQKTDKDLSAEYKEFYKTNIQNIHYKTNISNNTNQK